MRMSHAQMYERVLASDASCNGRFFLGVLTTGIYCLPSCRARKPKAENIRFFPSCQTAREAGLRACKKCHPDDFERGADPVLETVEALVAEVRAEPRKFPDARAIVRRSGFGATRVFELFRLHYHTTPADLLAEARVAAARRMLLDGKRSGSLLDVAEAAGFESQSAFHEHFRRLNGLTPSAYRELGADDDATAARGFTVTLPAGYPLALLWRTLGRDPNGVTERLEGGVFRAAIRIGADGAPALLTMRFEDGGRVRASCSRGPAHGAHAVVARVLGLSQDAAAFARLARRLGFARLVKGREGLRLVQTVSAFDGLAWAIIGQQINLPFAFQLRQRLALHAGEPAGDGLVALPAPATVAALAPEALCALKFSRQKADYLINAARLIVSGRLDLEGLRAMSATRVERILAAVRGLGPWSVNYLMMRSLGFADCVPYGDTGLTSGLQLLMKLEQRPGADATRRLMTVFSPHRSLATAHLWQMKQSIS
ncbi:AraC family transcriptional regulator [Termitidicoccus mucosus]|uniref:DNA-3-methyladenine glycosylase II n=2 Tax=Termitidicoccus mucosus TaxID=1184151 RepID=A0A178IH91_9BACT|nr:AraC family transcriptional regulator [Opitutaceae bacterium TSB47]